MTEPCSLARRHRSEKSRISESVGVLVHLCNIPDRVTLQETFTSHSSGGQKSKIKALVTQFFPDLQMASPGPVLHGPFLSVCTQTAKTLQRPF